MKLPSWAYGVLLAGLFIAGLFVGTIAQKNAVRAALLADSLKVVHRSEAELRDSLARNGATMHQDTVVVIKWRTAYATQHDTVLKNVHDTIAVIRFVHTADSTIQACNQLVTDCQARTRILQAENAACTEEVHLWKAQAPNVWQRHEVAIVVTTDVLSAIAAAFVAKKF